MKQKKALGKRAIAKTEEELYLQGSLAHIEELGELQNLFHAVEKKDLQEPNLAQWEKFENGLMSQIRSVEKEIGHRLWLQTWKDKITATDSICLKLLIYLVLAIAVAGVLLLGYVVYVMLSHQPLEQVAVHRAFLILWPAHAAISGISMCFLSALIFLCA